MDFLLVVTADKSTFSKENHPSMGDYIITNGISDGWFDSCHTVAAKVFQPIFSSFQFLFHFDGLLWIVIELLLLLPVFFRLYGFGVQQKLARFYNSTRYQLILFLYLFSASAALCSAIQICLPQPPACVTWDGLNYLPLRNNYLSPSFTIVLVTILVSFLFTVAIGIWYISLVVAIIFFVAIFLSAILSGSATINQALMSVAIGFWLFFIYRFMPPIFIPLAGAVIFIFSMSTFIFRIVEKGKDESFVQLCVVPGIRGCICLLIGCILYILHVKIGNQDNFNWFAFNWDKRNSNSSSSTGNAVIPDVVNTGSGDIFGKRLKIDILVGFISFVVVLGFNIFVAKYFIYEMFSST